MAEPLRGDPEKKNKEQYCRFHKDAYHDTDDCRQLKDEIEYLIWRMKYSRFTKGEDDGGRRRVYDGRDNDRNRNSQPQGPVINMIFRGPILAETTKNSWKAYAREVMNVVGETPKHAKTKVAIRFDDFDLEGVKFPMMIIWLYSKNRKFPS